MTSTLNIWLRAKSLSVWVVFATCLGLSVLVGCRKEQEPSPQNVIQYQLGGSISGRITGRSAEIPNLNDTFSFSAYTTPIHSIFFRQSYDKRVVKDTGTGPFIVIEKVYFTQFSFFRFSPTNGGSFSLNFPLLRRTDDTAASYLGLRFGQDLRFFLTDSAFIQLDGTISNQNTASTFDPLAKISQVNWDSAGGRISGNFNYKLYQRRNSSSLAKDSFMVAGQFNLPVLRAIR